MLHAALGLSAVVGVAVWGTVWFLAFWAYRRLRLPAIPWLAAYALVRMVLSLAPPIFMRAIMDGDAPQRPFVQGLGLSTESLLTIWRYVAISIGTVADGVVIALLVSEFVYVLSNSSLAQGVRIPSILSVPRSHATAFGLALLCICVLRTFAVTAIWDIWASS